MGSTKNKTAAQREKSQKDNGQAGAKGSGKKGKKSEKSDGPAKAEIVVALTDEQAAKYIKSAKAITVQELARQTGVRISAANAYLKEAARNQKVRVVAGYSGHRIYQPLS